MASSNSKKVGSAYLTVSPRLSASYQQDLVNYLKAADVTPAGRKIGEDLGEGIGGGVSAKAVAIGNIVSNVVTQAAQKAAQLIGDVVGGAFQNYASYEQLEGGIQKIFGEDSEAAAAVMRNASEAFKSAGLDANSYMKTVTGFSSSLIASLGGDTDKAAKLANQAIIDMSDNANTFGTDMESIQNAYQGFAKQNYTMLDNLNNMGALAA